LFIGNGGQVPTPRSSGNCNAETHGNLPAIATHAGIEAARCTWRWQAGGGQVASWAGKDRLLKDRHWRAGKSSFFYGTGSTPPA